MTIQPEPRRRRRLLSRLVALGLWVGVFLMALPLLMSLAGAASQWQLQRQWLAVVSTPHPPSTPASGAGSPAASANPGTAAATPSANPGHLLRLVIPEIGVNAVVVDDVTVEDLARGPGHFPETPWPSDDGNCVIAAHRNIWGCWFARLDELKPGDQVYLESPQYRYTYTVTKSGVISPSDVDILKSQRDHRELTLVTCTHPADQRIVVHAGILSVEPISAGTPG